MKRYDIEHTGSCYDDACSYWMKECEDGEYVKYSDVSLKLEDAEQQLVAYKALYEVSRKLNEDYAHTLSKVLSEY